MRRIATGRIGATVTVAAVVFLVHVRVVADDFTRLFCIERSQNANVVCYDARLRRDRTLDRDDSRLVKDTFNILQTSGERAFVQYIAFEDRKAPRVSILKLREVGHPSGQKVVEHLDLFPSLEQRLADVRTDKPSPASHQKFL